MARRSKPALKAIRAGRVNNDSGVPRRFQKIPTRNLMLKKAFGCFINSHSMNKIEKMYRMLLWFFMAVAATSLLPAVYFIKNSTRLFNSGYAGLNIGLDLLVFLGVPVLLSILSLCWMRHQAKDSMSDIDEISPVNNDYLPVYLGYIFVSLGIPAGASGGVDWVNLVVVYCMVCLFVAFSKSLCFNPVFILFGYGYYRVKTSNNVKVFVITKRKIRKSESKLEFSNLRKINELVYLDMDK